jgi:hypothetical protein
MLKEIFEREFVVKKSTTTPEHCPLEKRGAFDGAKCGLGRH